MGGTLLSDALLNHKYTIYRQAPLEGNTVYSDGEYSIRQNDFVLGLGVVTGADLAKEEELELTARPYADEHLLRTLAQSGQSIVREHAPTDLYNLSLTRNGAYYNLSREGSGDSMIEYQIPAADETRTYYFDCFDSLQNNLNEPYYKAFSIYVDGELVCKEYPTQSNNGIFELAVCANQSVRITVTVHKDVSVRSLGVFSVSHESLSQTLASMRSAQLETGRDTVSGTATAQADGEYLFLSLPYDKGYTATVNEQTVPIRRVFDAWMAIPLTEGENAITLRYRPQGFAAGAAMAAAGIVFTLAAGWFLSRKGRRIRPLEKPAHVLLFCLTVGVFTVIYLMPPAVYIVSRLISG